MDISKAICANCDRPLRVSQMTCQDCNVKLEAEFEISTQARLPLQDQLFVAAFIRHHGSIKQMEKLFGISYPTVKNRLNAIGAALDKTFTPPSAPLNLLEQVERGEITVEEALARMES